MVFKLERLSLDVAGIDKHRPFYRKSVLTSLIHADLVTLLNRDWVHDVRDNHMPLP